MYEPYVLILKGMGSGENPEDPIPDGEYSVEIVIDRLDDGRYAIFEKREESFSSLGRQVITTHLIASGSVHEVFDPTVSRRESWEK